MDRTCGTHLWIVRHSFMTAIIGWQANPPFVYDALQNYFYINHSSKRKLALSSLKRVKGRAGWFDKGGKRESAIEYKSTLYCGPAAQTVPATPNVRSHVRKIPKTFITAQCDLEAGSLTYLKMPASPIRLGIYRLGGGFEPIFFRTFLYVVELPKRLAKIANPRDESFWMVLQNLINICIVYEPLQTAHSRCERTIKNQWRPISVKTVQSVR